MEESLQLQIGTIFLIFFVSAIGFSLPFLLKSHGGIENLQEHPYFLILKSFASGIIIGVALMHLLADAVDNLDAYTSYPLALALCACGILSTLGLDQVAMMLIKTFTNNANLSYRQRRDYNENSGTKDALSSSDGVQREGNDGPAHGHDHKHEHHNDQSIESSRIKMFHDSEKAMPELQVLHNPESSAGHSHHHSHTMMMITDKDLNRAVVKSCVLEASIAIHSVIIGVSFGGLTSNDLLTIKVLMAALSFHQFFEGIALGSAMAESNFSTKVILLFELFFCLTWCIGAIIGIFATTDDTGVLVQGCFNAFAAGMLLYAGLIEMVAEDFYSSEIDNKPMLKLGMYLALLLGASAMAVLAIYA